VALDTRWKLPQGKTPDALYDCLFQLIRELRKGDYLPDEVASLAASAITYDNATSGLTADDAQAALDEIEGRVDDLEDVATGLALLASGTVSSQATLDVPLATHTGYRGFRLELTTFVPATDDVELWLRISQDGGSSYVSSGYKWLLERNRSGGTTPAGNGSTSDAQIKLIHSTGATEMVSNVASEGGADVTIEIWAASASIFPKVRAQSVWYGANTDIARSAAVGILSTADTADAIRILFESGNIASGKWALYGYL